jgi:hypothetical protein
MGSLWKAWTAYSVRSSRGLEPCVLPSGYLPLIWGGELPDENAFASIEEANATLSLTLRHWNSIASELDAESVHVPLVFEVETGAVPGLRSLLLSGKSSWTTRLREDGKAVGRSPEIFWGERHGHDSRMHV